MNFAAFQRSTGERLLVNLDTVTHVGELGDGTCVVNVVGDGECFAVKETFEEIVESILARAKGTHDR